MLAKLLEIKNYDKVDNKNKPDFLEVWWEWWLVEFCVDEIYYR